MKLSSIKTKLMGCGYRADWLRSDYQFSDNQTIKPLVGFAQLPFDARNSCVAVLESQGDPRSEVEQCRPTGAPLVFVCAGDSLQWWRQGADAPHWLESVNEDRLDDFFVERKYDFSPDAIYRVKTWGRFRSEFQLSFVDVGRRLLFVRGRNILRFASQRRATQSNAMLLAKRSKQLASDQQIFVFATGKLSEWQGLGIFE